MESYSFEDALVKRKVTCSFPGLDTLSESLPDAGKDATSLFFPGCSFINYSIPLMQAVYDLLEGAGRVDGISLLCCGKILEYEPNASEVRPAFEQQFREHIAATQVKRIVAACPNCVAALRGLLAEDERTAGVEVIPLITELVDMGYRVDAETAQRVAHEDPRIDASTTAVFSVKDSCPDRATGEFASGLRLIMENQPIVEPLHNRRKSICCGSRPRAAGRMDAAFKSCVMNHDEARAAGANALVTSCMSCTFLLSTLNPDLPVYHYLELLFEYRIPWEYADQYMKLRFLFSDSQTNRSFMGIE